MYRIGGQCDGVPMDGCVGGVASPRGAGQATPRSSIGRGGVCSTSSYWCAPAAELAPGPA